MLHAFQVFTAALVTLAVAPAAAHLLEFPGKMRLNREGYFLVQHIYYPGFTISGAVAEVASVVATFVLLLLSSGAAFWFTLIAFVTLGGMQAVFWVFTRPVDRHWIHADAHGTLSERFFAIGAAPPASILRTDWRQHRVQWEISHVTRAAMSFASLLSILIAMAFTA